MENINEIKKSKLVFDPRVARRLCKKGFYIIDLKPLRGEPDKSVFVFENTEEFQVAHTEIIDEFNNKNEVEESLVCED
jgi:hypothetical protein